MKELTAVIRRDRLPHTKKALDELGFSSMSIQSVDGRGKQKGVIGEEIDAEIGDDSPASVKLKPTPSAYALEHTITRPVLYVPKRMLTLVVPDDVVGKVVKTIIKVNQTGEYGDGRIFVSPVEDAVRVRTGERGGEAIA